MRIATTRPNAATVHYLPDDVEGRAHGKAEVDCKCEGLEYWSVPTKTDSIIITTVTITMSATHSRAG